MLSQDTRNTYYFWKKKFVQVIYMLNINTNLHFNLYFLHWADTSVLFITLEKNIPTRFWKDTKTQQSWGSGRSVLRIILMRSETWNVVTFELEYPEERKHRVALARNHCNLCVCILHCRDICYTVVPDTGGFCNCRVVQGPHWSIPFSHSFPCLLNQAFSAIPFDLPWESCTLSMKWKDLELLY